MNTLGPELLLAAIPSPEQNVLVYLGPVPVHFYALCILAGIGVATWWATRRWKRHGGDPDTLFDIVMVAIFAGIIGARIYHVLSSPDAYFGPNGHLIDVFMIWNGGLGIWGAVALGGLAAWFMARRKRVRFGVLADCIAPTLLVGQAIGRLGNWFNQELYGGPTTLPWALHITCRDGQIPGCVPGYYHPTFLYEMIWNLLGAVLLVLVERRFRLGGGRVFWLYVMVYTAGRSWIEAMRIDPAELIFGIRLNVWTSLLLFLVGLIMFLVLTKRAQTHKENPEAHLDPIPVPAPVAQK
ncbi:prolipoprotein diacylglyceryl transferase [Devriesea agamarum]|uniref:prolipoprotein diacylglyceryl transferase n=1 Tax=Devriesea agamarum TaxID=472569 RepID=UPI00071C220F|nr:prolipoprotein diacylglyceryl transferase [Devriesea agamarum]